MEAGKVVFEASRCVKCDTCIRVCEHQASPRIQMMSVAAVSYTHLDVYKRQLIVSSLIQEEKNARA